MITGIRLEVLPRYGSPVGNIWISQVFEDGKGNEEVVGSIQIRNKEEQEIWERVIRNENERIEKVIQELSPKVRS